MPEPFGVKREKDFELHRMIFRGLSYLYEHIHCRRGKLHHLTFCFWNDLHSRAGQRGLRFMSTDEFVFGGLTDR